MSLPRRFATSAILLVLLTTLSSPSKSTVRPNSDITDVPFEHVIIDNNFPDESQFHGDCKGIADIDGDGLLDMVFAGNTLVWYAYPSWRKTVIAKATQEFTTDMQLGDVDSDGDPDVIVPDGEKGKLCWFENPRPKGDPAKDSWKCHLIGYQGDWAHDVEVGDINGDGKLDVLTRKTSTLVWFQNNPDSFTQVVIDTALPNGEGSALADINRDGYLDIVQNGYWLECHEIQCTGTGSSTASMRAGLASSALRWQTSTPMAASTCYSLRPKAMGGCPGMKARGIQKMGFGSNT
jgi:hypothetical protein